MKSMQWCYLQLLLSLLQLIIYIGTITINYFICTLAYVNFCMHPFNKQLRYALFRLTTYIGLLQLPAFVMGNFCMSYCNSIQLLYVLLQLKTSFAALFPIDNLSCKITIINFCMNYCN